MSPAGPDLASFDSARLFQTLRRYEVVYLLIGGLSARAYGAQRLTFDLDCLPAASPENLHRLALALIELNARLRINGLSDNDVSKLPIDVEAVLRHVEISGWSTDAGVIDVTKTMPDKDGRRVGYEDLVGSPPISVVAGGETPPALIADLLPRGGL